MITLLITTFTTTTYFFKARALNKSVSPHTIHNLSLPCERASKNSLPPPRPIAPFTLQHHAQL